MNALLMFVVLGMVALAIAVDVAAAGAVINWLLRVARLSS